MPANRRLVIRRTHRFIHACGVKRHTGPTLTSMLYAMIETVSSAFNPSSRTPSTTTLDFTMSAPTLLVNSFHAWISSIVT